MGKSSTSTILLGAGAVLAGVAAALAYRHYIGSDGQNTSRKSLDVQEPEPEVTMVRDGEGAPGVTEKYQDAELKALYNQLKQEGMVLFKEKKMGEACEKLTECLALLEQLDAGTMQRDRVILLNNRSGMYERMAQYDAALKDIEAVLKLMPDHHKCRVRRARIFEKQGKMKEALLEYAIAMVIESNKGVQSMLIDGKKTVREKVEDINKSVAVGDAMELFETSQENTSRALQGKMSCNDFFDVSPTYHLYRKKAAIADRRLLNSKVMELEEQAEKSAEWLRHILDLIWHDICHGAFKNAFALVNKALPDARVLLESSQSAMGEGAGGDGASVDAATALRDDALELLNLAGAEMTLRCCQGRAIALFEEVLTISPDNLEANLRLADCLTESGAISRAEKLYETLSELYVEHVHGEKSGDAGATRQLLNKAFSAHQIAQDEYTLERRMELLKAWVLTHRIILQKFRAEDGQWREGAISNAMGTISEILTTTEALDGDETIACHICAQLQTVQLLSHTKRQTGQVPSDSDAVRVRACVAEVKRLRPEHVTLPYLEADLLNADGDTEGAIKMCDEAIRVSDEGDGFPYVMKANISQIWMIHSLQRLEAGDRTALPTFQLHFGQIMDLYKKALEEEPDSVEAMQQMAHLLGMMGDGSPIALQEALDLLERATQLGRNLDEIVDIVTQRNHLRICIEATKVVANFRK